MEVTRTGIQNKRPKPSSWLFTVANTRKGKRISKTKRAGLTVDFAGKEVFLGHLRSNPKQKERSYGLPLPLDRKNLS